MFAVGYLVFPGFQLQHIAGPLAAFEAVGGLKGGPYTSVFMSEFGGTIGSSGGLRVETQPLSGVASIDKLFVSGGLNSLHVKQSDDVLDFLRRSARSGVQVAAPVSAAILLAASGVLDGHRATTHWSLSTYLSHHYPAVDIQPDELVVRDGQFWTASTIYGGIEIARMMIEEDLGKDASKRAARDFLSYHLRVSDGDHAVGSTKDKFRPLIAWMRENLHQNLSLDVLAEQVGMHPRHFCSAFASAIGQTPAKAIERMRIQEAFALIEGTALPMAQIAQNVGFKSVERMRRAFIRTYAMPPLDLRNRYVNARESR